MAVKSKRILTVTLNPALDELVNIDGFALGREFVASEASLSAGGKGVNVSRVLKNLKIKNLATGLLGSCTGIMIKDFLDSEGIKNDFVKIKENTRTSLTIKDRKSHHPTRLLQHGPKVSHQEIRSFKKKYNALLNQFHLVVLSGRNAAGVSHSIYSELIELAHKQNRPVILDTHGLPLHYALKAKPYCIKPNLHEAEVELKKRLNSLNKLKSAIRHFHKRGIPVVIISLGSEGAIGSNGEDIWLATPPKVKCRNHVGCGDAFIGGLIASFMGKEDFVPMLRMAVATGTANAMSLQPGAVTKRSIAKVRNKVKIKKV